MDRGPKLLVAGIALAAAAACYAYMSSPDSIKDAANDEVLFKCIVCDTETALTPANAATVKRFLLAAEEVDDASTNSDGSKGHYGRSKVGITAIVCPSCKKVGALPASKCPTDGTVFLTTNRDNTMGKCPACGWHRGSEG